MKMRTAKTPLDVCIMNIMTTELRVWIELRLMLCKFIKGLLKEIKVEILPRKHGCVSGLGCGCGYGCWIRQFLKRVGAGAARLGD